MNMSPTTLTSSTRSHIGQECGAMYAWNIQAKTIDRMKHGAANMSSEC